MKRGPYKCAHVTADRVAYDAKMYAKNRDAILARKRAKYVFARRKLRLHKEESNGSK